MKALIISLFFLSSMSSFSQDSLDKLLNKHNNNSVPYMNVETLNLPRTQVKILDAREIKEFNVSHLKNAIHVGYDHFEIDSVLKRILDKKSKIVVYCSIGIRSEDIGEKLQKAGYSNVYNLYGGIFEWKNNNLPVYDSSGIETQEIHTYSKSWSTWLKNGVKVYD